MRGGEELPLSHQTTPEAQPRCSRRTQPSTHTAARPRTCTRDGAVCQLGRGLLAKAGVHPVRVLGLRLDRHTPHRQAALQREQGGVLRSRVRVGRGDEKWVGGGRGALSVRKRAARDRHTHTPTGTRSSSPPARSGRAPRPAGAAPAGAARGPTGAARPASRSGSRPPAGEWAGGQGGGGGGGGGAHARTQGQAGSKNMHTCGSKHALHSCTNQLGDAPLVSALACGSDLSSLSRNLRYSSNLRRYRGAVGQCGTVRHWDITVRAAVQ